MLNLFYQLAKDLKGINVANVYSKIDDKAADSLPDVIKYPFDEMIQYAKKSWLNRFSRDMLIKDLTMLKKIAQQQYEFDTRSYMLSDEIINKASDKELDYIMTFTKSEELKQIFNPISKTSKSRLNESYKRILNKRSNARTENENRESIGSVVRNDNNIPAHSNGSSKDSPC